LNQPPSDHLHVYTFGSGENAELGLGVKIESKRDPTAARYPRRVDTLDIKTVGVIEVATGGMHAAALTHDNRVFTWGVNDSKALGRDTSWREPSEGLPDDVADLNPLESTPASVPLNTLSLESHRITQIAASDSATLGLTDDGRVFGWGSFRVRDFGTP
jgi:regulator of chromosome condensation